MDNVLLSLLLTLRSGQPLLSDLEKTQLYELGERLQLLKPERWNFVKQTLLNIVAANPTRQEQFQAYLSKLENHGRPIILDSLPNNEELAAELGTESTLERRGFRPGQSQESFNQALINDLVVPILLSDNPPETTEKVSFLERLRQKLQQIERDDALPPMSL